jgi:hypothetical protein
LEGWLIVKGGVAVGGVLLEECEKLKIYIHDVPDSKCPLSVIFASYTLTYVCELEVQYLQRYRSKSR